MDQSSVHTNKAYATIIFIKKAVDDDLILSAIAWPQPLNLPSQDSGTAFVAFRKSSGPLPPQHVY